MLRDEGRGSGVADHTFIRVSPRQLAFETFLYCRPSSVYELPQVFAAAWMAQLAQRLGFDLSNSLARYRKALADLFQRVILTFIDSEPQPQDLLLARRQGRQRLAGLVAQADAHHRLGRCQ